ncbi:hypothetical protein EXS92_06700 [Helicobacter pylori]|nr:hypothetical protein [Helicobacter pylori]NHB32489.1 hypothetical protein [Helicobacter pylori]QEF20524.1 hypothetical protein D2C87_00700 [Helicobacter pylori]
MVVSPNGVSSACIFLTHLFNVFTLLQLSMMIKNVFSIFLQSMLKSLHKQVRVFLKALPRG